MNVKTLIIVLIVSLIIFLSENCVFAYREAEISGTYVTQKQIYDNYGEIVSEMEEFGAVFLVRESGELTITQSVNFSSNTAGMAGGSILNEEGKVKIESNVAFQNNKASYRGQQYSGGGAIFNVGSQASLDIGNNSSFTGNVADSGGDGGAISNHLGTVTIGSNATFAGNVADSGGAISNYLGTVTIGSNATFEGSEAIRGAVYNSSIFTIQDGAVFSNNMTNYGAIYNDGNSAVLNLIANTNNIHFVDNDIAIYDNEGAINLWTNNSASIIFEDIICSEDDKSILNINYSSGTLPTTGKIWLKNDMNGYKGTVNLYGGEMILDDDYTFFDTENFTIHGGTFTANASYILKDFTNNGTVLFTGGENINWIHGDGTTIIDGEVINSSTIINNITINLNKKLTTDADEIKGSISNNGNLIVTGGTNKNNITGDGTTIINGMIINDVDSTIENTVIINESKQLTTNASNIIGAIENNGKLVFTGTENNNYITGNGETQIKEKMVNNGVITQNIIRINNSLENNSTITATDMYIDGIFKIGKNGSFYNATNSIIGSDAQIYLQDNKIKNYNFGNLTIDSGQPSLFVDADLAKKEMDTIAANEGSNVNGEINVKAINILADNNEKETAKVLFTNSTVLKDKIISINTASSKLYRYDIVYNDGYFNFRNIGKSNPIIFESAVAGSAGGLITQMTILNQTFSNMDNIRNRIIQVKQKGLLYASAVDLVFENPNRIESGLWIRPFVSQDSVKLGNLDIDNTLTGTLAGLDLAVGENWLTSFYLGYAGSNQKYENIKVSQTGYIIGATGLFIEDNWYAGLTANVNFNKADSESVYGTDSFDLNMYGIGAKAGYNYEINNKWILEPNLTLMYGSVSNQEYKTIQGAKIGSQNNSNIMVEPQVKAKVVLDNGWQPYGLLGYAANISDKVKVKADGINLEMDKVDGYIEYGLGINKTFKNSPWSCFLQIAGRNGGMNGFGGNIGVKYSFLNKSEKQDIELIKYLKEKEKLKNKKI